MPRKDNLENGIRESYGLIREYEAIMRTSDRPEEKARARRVIQDQWAHVEGYLAEYRLLVGDALPEDLAQLAARFSSLAELSAVEDKVAATETLRGTLPDGQLEDMLAAFTKERASLRAWLWGSGAVAQGTGAQAVGQRGIGARDFQGLAITGDRNIVVLANEVAAAFWGRFASTRLSEDELRQVTGRYLAHLLDRYRYLDFRGMGVSDRVPLRLPLVEMYVPLKARIELPEGETWARQLHIAGRQVSEGEAEAMGQRLSEPTPVLNLLRENDGLIILGDPGAGKTTFLKYLALRLARGEGKVLNVGVRLPILVPLSAYANALADRDVPLVRFIAGYYRERGVDMPIGPMLDEALAQGGALFLLDGLDEVRDLALRHVVVERVEDCFTVHSARGNKFVLTSRVVGYVEVRPATEGLAECTLVDLDDEDIREFVEKWTAALERAARGDTPVAALEAAREREELLAAVRHNSGVRQLAANPLLLTILALMKRQGVTLPERRVELYAKYVETLLKHWNLARGLGRPSARDLDVVETVRVLAPLALWMHEISPGVGLVKRGEVQRKLKEIYAQRGVDEPERSARQLLRDAREYASLLLERGSGAYGFIHLTFQEYLAAVAIAQRGQRDVGPVVEALAEHVGDDNWYEVTRLTIGYMGIVQQRDEAAGSVVWNLIASSLGKLGQVMVWAGDAVVDAWPGGVTPRCKERMARALAGAMTDDRRIAPILRARAADALAKLGDSRPGVGLHPGGLPDIAWCAVPAGSFLMGSSDVDEMAWNSEKPQHEVRLPAFSIARYPVTNVQYGAFVEDGGYTQEWRDCWTEAGWRWKKDVTGPDTFGGAFDLPNHPVVGVSWYEALAFCRWLTARLRQAAQIGQDKEVVLPSEAQWEKAARGVDGRIYPWGDDTDPNRANYDDTEIGTTSAVGCFPGGASPCGCLDMSGNVWEWCRTKWQGSYEDYREDNDPAGEDGRVVRGGSFFDDRVYTRCAVRLRGHPRIRFDSSGFRVVVSPISP
jgi:formylglycine-generating enzyme required for sulfatase activity